MTPQQYNTKNNHRRKMQKIYNKIVAAPASQLRVHTANSSGTQLLLLYEITHAAAVHDEVNVNQQQ